MEYKLGEGGYPLSDKQALFVEIMVVKVPVVYESKKRGALNFVKLPILALSAKGEKSRVFLEEPPTPISPLAVKHYFLIYKNII